MSIDKLTVGFSWQNSLGIPTVIRRFNGTGIALVQDRNGKPYSVQDTGSLLFAGMLNYYRQTHQGQLPDWNEIIAVPDRTNTAATANQENLDFLVPYTNQPIGVIIEGCVKVPLGCEPEVCEYQSGVVYDGFRENGHFVICVPERDGEVTIDFLEGYTKNETRQVLLRPEDALRVLRGILALTSNQAFLKQLYQRAQTFDPKKTEPNL